MNLDSDVQANVWEAMYFYLSWSWKFITEFYIMTWLFKEITISLEKYSLKYVLQTLNFARIHEAMRCILDVCNYSLMEKVVYLYLHWFLCTCAKVIENVTFLIFFPLEIFNGYIMTHDFDLHWNLESFSNSGF